MSAEELGFERVPISFSQVEKDLAERLAATSKGTVLTVDMGWGLQTASATANFEGWMAVAQDLAAMRGCHIVSLYNRSLLIDEHLLAALRGHPAVLAPEGVMANPHWLPPQLNDKGTLREQVNFWLGGIAPSLVRENPNADRHAAEGADPMWLLNRRAEEPTIPGENTRERWKIRCFGRLRVYRADGSQVEWAVPGGATMKTKTLFAYLLQQGGKGARADDLGDLLWPDAESAEAARNRLYHTVRSLRQALEGARHGKAGGYILRDGSSYVLVPPERSWLDISAFEQLCRQSQSHIKAGDLDEALVCLRAADRLYTGDLFEDIPSEYVDDQERDWCWTRRYWLRDMYLKVQRDAARICRGRADYSAALSHCQEALKIDPLAEFAHEEAMRTFAAQGRREAIERQYALYTKSLSRFDDRPRNEDLAKLFKSLTS
ncbi:AfsR/SARP family transcriptional regulator [Thalassovita mangrovi]|nr:BTAD domain-containing putative transcriptional regulator [Thalassovita mangrovi]